MTTTPLVAVVGAGPAGLMAAEAAAAGGARVTVFDAMPSAGRKFLLAGRGGLNLTHAEPQARFVTRFGDGLPLLASALAEFGAQAVREWARGLGIETFVGSSGRVFPKQMKASPLLRAWLRRLSEREVRFELRHRLVGLRATGGPAIRFATPGSCDERDADAVVLALGGGSWPRLGADGAWMEWLAAAGVAVAPLAPSNCGFECRWSEHLRTNFAGAPVKNVVAWIDGEPSPRRGEFVITDYGIEGGLVYALGGALRSLLNSGGDACLRVDLAPDVSLARVAELLAEPRGRRTLASALTRQLRLDRVKQALLHECLPKSALADPLALAAGIKALPLQLTGTRPLAEAISSAGGVRAEALDERLMLLQLPGVFCAGEMLDWDAPTGGYLLTAAFATGRRAGAAAAAYAAARTC